MQHPLVDVEQIDAEVEAHLSRAGRIFRAFRHRDSGCTAFGVEIRGVRWFVKHSDDPRGVESLERAQSLHRVVRHPALPALHNAFRTPGGLALVYEWVDGELKVNAPNCVDCKATDVLGPRWTPREGGSGPKYKRM